MNLREEPGFTALLARLGSHRLPPLDMYKEKCLRRRLAVRMRACGVTTLSEYAALVETVPGEPERLLEALTINVTGFFRNPEAWSRLEEELHRRPAGPAPLRAWSAGCATGEEAWTLAMILAELAARPVTPASRAGAAQPGFHLDATDVDESCLVTARAATYSAAAFADAPPGKVSRWTVPAGDRRAVLPLLRDGVRFLRHDLGRDPPPALGYDVIVCRNVLIYFEREIHERLFPRFADALRPGGLLFLGPVESPTPTSRAWFDVVDVPARLLRRRS